MSDSAGGLESQGVIRSLRAVMPQHTVSFRQAAHRAELQAMRLLTLNGIRSAPVPVSVVTALPKVRVQRVHNLPVSGSAHWTGNAWVIAINAEEPHVRQRFSLFHELKHIIDHPTSGTQPSHAQAERIADLFAACVLMPRAWVRSAYQYETQSCAELAVMFQVSELAMSYRLEALRLTRPFRCDPTDEDPIGRKVSMTPENCALVTVEK